MNDARKVSYEERGAVRVLRINRPEQRNCVDGETAEGLGRASASRRSCAPASRASRAARATPRRVRLHSPKPRSSQKRCIDADDRSAR